MGRNSNVAHLTHLFGFAIGWLYFVVRFGANPARYLFRR
jgi:membrane associated rhomboid family serine protease